MSAAYDLACYLRNTIGVGTALGTDLFCNDMPDHPDDCISVYQYGGSPSNRGHGPDTGSLENFSLQVNVRSTNAETAESVCYAIYKALDILAANVIVNSVTYTWLRPLHPPFLLERDQSRRCIYVFNLEAQRVKPA
jgi:hypothetical protein